MGIRKPGVVEGQVRSDRQFDESGEHDNEHDLLLSVLTHCVK